MMGRDDFALKLKMLMVERNVQVQFNMLLLLFDDFTHSYLIPFEEAKYRMGHSFSDSFNTIDTNRNGLLMRLEIRGIVDKEFLGEVLFLLMAIGKVETLKWLYEKIPWVFKSTNMEMLFNEISSGERRATYWNHIICFWTIGKNLK